MITYAYFVMDIFKNRERRFVEESFESLAGQTDDIIVMDYGSTDDIKEVSLSYGFRFYSVEKTPNQFFHISKMTNKAIFEAKNKLFSRVTVDVIYEKNVSNFILKWHENKSKNEVLILQVKKSYSNFKSSMTVYEKEKLLQTRGVDERISFYGGEHRYLREVYLNRFKLNNNFVYEPFKLWHRPHKRDYPIKPDDEIFVKEREWTNNRILELKNNFEKEIKNAVNSYF